MKELPLPTRTTRHTRAKKMFVQCVEQISAGWRLSASGEGTSPQMSRNGRLKREIYALVRHFLAQDHGNVIKEIVEDDGRAPANGPAFEDNPFHWGLLSLFEARGDGLSRGDRYLFARQMLYAHKHDVPPNLLVGFIYQSGKPQDIAQKLLAGTFEPGFTQ